MKELINLIINMLASMQNNEQINIAKQEDNNFVFSGQSVDNGVPYGYEINVRFFLLNSSTSSTNSEAIKQTTNSIENTLKQIQSNDDNFVNMESLKSTIQELIKKEIDKNKETNLLNEKSQN